MLEKVEKNVSRTKPSRLFRRSPLFFGAFFWLSACVSGHGADQRLAESDESNSQVEVVGYAVFFGEFRLFDSEEASERDDGVCVSGALPLAEHRIAATKFDHSMVKVVGVIRPWVLSDNMLSLNYEGSEIQNGCDGKEVIFASSMKSL